MIKLPSSDKGFTLVELIVASAVFSLMLLTTSAIIIQVGRLYYKGTVLTKTQNSATTLLNAIAEPIRLENTTVVKGRDNRVIGSGPAQKNVNSVCIGNSRITYVEGLSMGGTGYDANAGTIPHPVWLDTVDVPADCSDSSKEANITASNPGDGQDLLEENMRLTNIRVEAVDSDTNPNLEGGWFVEVGVLYGEADVVNPVPPDVPQQCNGAIAGSQWCAHSSLETMVFKRINDPNN